MNVNIIDAGASVLLVWLLLPRMGLWGYVVAIYATETLNTTLSLCRMLRMSRMPVSLWRQVFGPLLCAVGATVTLRLAGAVFLPRIGGTMALAVRITVCAALYLGLCMATGVWGREQTKDIRRIFGQ
jgi:O-antigen/teichoic acid export membrane protein